jgi:hypothetical protein
MPITVAALSNFRSFESWELTREWSDPTCRNLFWFFFFFTVRVHDTKSTDKILAAKTHCKYFLKIAEVTHFFCPRNRLYQRFLQPFLALTAVTSQVMQQTPRLWVSHYPCCILALPCPASARGGHFSNGLAGYNIGHVQQFLKKYLQCVLTAKILTVDFVMCTLAVGEKKNQGRFRHVGSDHSLVSRCFFCC